MEDKEIVSLYWARSDRALTETAAKYGSYCLSISRRIVPCHEDAEECVQDTWLQAWNGIPPARPERLKAFLGRITRNLSLDRLRLQSREKRGGGEVQLCFEELEGMLSDGQESIADTLALREALNGFLASLPKQTRVIFLRRYWYFQSVKEIAADLGLRESKVKMTLLRTRNRLQQALEQEELL